MLRTGSQYLDSLRDGREVYINGTRVDDVTRHAMLKPLVDIRAAVYRNFDWDGPLDFVRKAAGLSDRVMAGTA